MSNYILQTCIECGAIFKIPATPSKGRKRQYCTICALVAEKRSQKRATEKKRKKNEEKRRKKETTLPVQQQLFIKDTPEWWAQVEERIKNFIDINWPDYQQKE